MDELVPAREESLELECESLTVSQLLVQLAARHSGLEKHIDTRSDEGLRRHVIVVVGDKIAALTDILRDGDTVKLLPPISGGNECCEEPL